MVVVHRSITDAPPQWPTQSAAASGTQPPPPSVGQAGPHATRMPQEYSVPQLWAPHAAAASATQASALASRLPESAPVASCVVASVGGVASPVAPSAPLSGPSAWSSE